MLDFLPNPIAFQLGPLPVYWYGIGYAVGLAVAYQILVRLARRAGEDPEVVGNGMIVIAIASSSGTGSGGGAPRYERWSRSNCSAASGLTS